MNTKQSILFVILLLGIGGLLYLGKGELSKQRATYNKNTRTTPRAQSIITCSVAGLLDFQTTANGCDTYKTIKANIQNSHQPNTQPLNNWETEANLSVIGTGESYDFLLLGSSHGRIFSRYHNHERVEEVTDKHFINLSQGGDRAGFKDQHAYLQYFYEQKNSAKMVVYLVDPYMFYHTSMDNNPKLFALEPARLDFLRTLLSTQPQDAYMWKSYANQFQNPPPPVDFSQYLVDGQNQAMTELPPTAEIDERIQTLYKDTHNKTSFEQATQSFLRIPKLARKNGSSVVVITPSTLLPEQPQDAYVYEALINNQKGGEYKYQNDAHALTDFHYFYNIDHLNTPGVVHFARTYLNPILSK